MDEAFADPAAVCATLGPLLLDERRCIVDVNGALIRLVQHQRAQLVGHPAHELVRDGPLFTTAQWRELLAQLATELGS